MKPTVLVIDDEKNLCELVEETLYASGFSVISAGTVAAGLEIALAQPPDMVLCDVMLPDGIGFDAARALNDHPATRHVPVVMMTGNPDAQDHVDAAGRTMLLKPFFMPRLVETVQQNVLPALARN